MKRAAMRATSKRAKVTWIDEAALEDPFPFLAFDGSTTTVQTRCPWLIPMFKSESKVKPSESMEAMTWLSLPTLTESPSTKADFPARTAMWLDPALLESAIALTVTGFGLGQSGLLI